MTITMEQWWGRQDKESAREAAPCVTTLWKRTKLSRQEKKQANNL